MIITPPPLRPSKTTPVVEREIIAVDVDLRKITAVSNRRGVLADRAADYWPVSDFNGEALFLMEIAGPIMHRAGNQNTMHGTHKWMIYNAATIGKWGAHIENLLVCTSTAWTQGYEEKARHAIAGLHPLKHTKAGHPQYKHPHDIRECLCMLYFFKINPNAWKPLPTFLESL